MSISRSLFGTLYKVHVCVLLLPPRTRLQRQPGSQRQTPEWESISVSQFTCICNPVQTQTMSTLVCSAAGFRTVVRCPGVAPLGNRCSPAWSWGFARVPSVRCVTVLRSWLEFVRVYCAAYTFSVGTERLDPFAINHSQVASETLVPPGSCRKPQLGQPSAASAGAQLVVHYSYLTSVVHPVWQCKRVKSELDHKLS